MTFEFADILNISLTSSFLILAIILLRGVLKKAPKFYFCILWGIAGLRLILPFSLENIYSPVPSYYTVEQTFYNISEAQNSSVYFGEMLTYIWLAGVAFMAIYGFISYLRTKARILPSIKLQDNVYLCDGIDSPFILGMFNAKIYIPSDLDKSRINDVLRHEKAHLKRGDHFWKPLGFLVLTLHWFNPVVWLAYVLLCRDIEKACDEKVISKMGKDAKIGYLESLVVCSVHRKRIALCPVAFGEIGVKSRVKLILDYKRPTFKLLVLCTLIGCLVVAFLFTSSSNTYFDVINESMEVTNNEKQIDYEKLNSLNIGKINFKNSGTSSSKVNKSASVKKESASTVVYQTSSTTSSSVNLVDSSRSLSHDNLTVQEKLKYGYTTPDYLLSEAVSGMTVAQRNQSIINSLYSNRNNVNNQQNFGYNTSNGSIKIFP